jgi:hypothetical protein
MKSPASDTSTTLMGFHCCDSTFIDSNAPRSPSVRRRGRPVAKSKVVVDGSPLRVAVGCSQLGAARTVLDYRAWHHDVEVARARGTICPFDFATGRPRRLTDGERGAFLLQVSSQTHVIDVALTVDIGPADRHLDEITSLGHIHHIPARGENPGDDVVVAGNETSWELSVGRRASRYSVSPSGSADPAVMPSSYRPDAVGDVVNDAGRIHRDIS